MIASISYTKLALYHTYVVWSRTFRIVLKAIGTKAPFSGGFAFAWLTTYHNLIMITLAVTLKSKMSDIDNCFFACVIPVCLNAKLTRVLTRRSVSVGQVESNGPNFGHDKYVYMPLKCCVILKIANSGYSLWDFSALWMRNVGLIAVWRHRCLRSVSGQCLSFVRCRAHDGGCQNMLDCCYYPHRVTGLTAAPESASMFCHCHINAFKNQKLHLSKCIGININDKMYCAFYNNARVTQSTC